MRVATLFKRLLRLGRERVVRVTLFEGAEEQVLVELARPQRRRMRCPHCGFATRATYDRSVRTWRHLDALRTRCLLRCEVRRIVCPDCGVVSEEVPWARPGSRFTRAFEDTCAFLVRDAPKTVVAQLMRIDWATVGRVLERVVDEALGQSEDWLDGLRRIGVDEVAYRKGHRYLLCVVDHDTGRIVWAHPGRSKATLALFFAELGPERKRPAGGGVGRSARRLAAGDLGACPPGGDLRRSIPRRQARRRRARCAAPRGVAAAQEGGSGARALVQGHPLPPSPPR
jgi:transposase